MRKGVFEVILAFTLTAHPSCQAQCNVAFLPGVNYLHFVVVAVGGERPARLGQTNVHDAFPLANVFQKLKERFKEKEQKKQGFILQVQKMEKQIKESFFLQFTPLVIC